MSQSTNSHTTGSNIPVSEMYWSLVDKADQKFSKIRDLPYYDRHRYDMYFYKSFKVYTKLWKFQQENRQKLVEAGIKRWEIGEIASRIAQLFFGQYMRTSEANYLSESYVFYEAILSREYFREGLFQDINLANKQLRFLARFLMVCLILNRREMMHQLVSQLKMLLDECKRTFQENDFREWKLVVQEIARFLKVDTAFMNIRPLRYSMVLDLHPDSLPSVASRIMHRNLRLRDAILSSYHHNEVRFSELALDTFRMLQSLEWEPSGTFYQPSSTKIGHVGSPGTTRINNCQDIVDHTLPKNPRKTILYCPSVTHFMAACLLIMRSALERTSNVFSILNNFDYEVLATICEELPLDGVLLVYFSASGVASRAQTAPSCLAGVTLDSESISSADNIAHSSPLSPLGHPCDNINPSSGQSERTNKNGKSRCLDFGGRGNEGINCIYPSDLIPFTRKPLLLVIDSDCSEAFEAIRGEEKGEPAAMLLSPSSCTVFFHQQGESLFTIFLTAPLQGLCLLLGISGSEVEMDTYNKADELLSSSLNEWGLTLATEESLDPVWAQILTDPFIRRLLLRFIFCLAVLTLYGPTSSKPEFLPKCFPSLPESVMPPCTRSQTAVLRIANVLGATDSFIFSKDLLVPENIGG